MNIPVLPTELSQSFSPGTRDLFPPKSGSFRKNSFRRRRNLSAWAHVDRVTERYFGCPVTFSFGSIEYWTCSFSWMRNRTDEGVLLVAAQSEKFDIVYTDFDFFFSNTMTFVLWNGNHPKWFMLNQILSVDSILEKIQFIHLYVLIG